MAFTSTPRVFLSYARADGEGFATALRHRLEREEPEITLWQDRAQLEGGIGWWRQVEAALDRVKFLVIVMTPAALISEVTRKEWRYARQRGVIVYPVKGVPDREIEYDLLPHWMRKVHFFDLGQFRRNRWHDAKEWDTFVSYLKADRQPARVPFMAPDLPEGFVSREHELEQLLQLVLDPARENPVAITTALHGSGGYGKTTLAAAVCHHARVIEAFDDGILWASLGQTPHLVGELTKLHEALTGEQLSFVDAGHAATALAEKLEHRNCLLVLDDVWERAHAEPFLRRARGTARLITTRRFDLLASAVRVKVDEMSVAESVQLLATAFEPGQAPRGALQPLAARLGEWPLLMRLAAGMLRTRLALGDSVQGALEYVAHALDKRGVTAFDREDTAQRHEAVRRTVAASADQLSTVDRRRLRELVIFPEEAEIPLTTLSRLWGADDLDTQECAQRLHGVSLVSLDLGRGVVTLHDVMRTYLLGEVTDVRQVHVRLVQAYRDLTRLPDQYAWRWLPYHLFHAGQSERLGDLLLQPEWLCEKLRATGPSALLRDFDLLHGDRELDLVQAAIHLAAPILAVDPEQVFEQLLGRLPAGLSERIDRFRLQLRRTGPFPRLHARFVTLQRPGAGLVQTLVCDDGVVVGALLLPDGRVLSWSQGGTLRVWELTTGEGRALTGHEACVNDALLLPDGRALSYSDDRTLRVWDLTTGESQVLKGHSGAVRGALLLPDGRVLSWSRDRTLRVWDLTTGKSRALRGHQDEVTGALLLPDGRALSWSNDGRLGVWDLGVGEGTTLTGHEGAVCGALLLLDGRPLSWSQDGTLRVWDVATGESRVLRGHQGAVYGALLLPDGRVLSWALERTLGVWDLATCDGRSLVGHEAVVNGALLLPDGRALSWSIDRTLRVWDLTTGEGRALTGHEASVVGAWLLPNGDVLSVSLDLTVRVWDPAMTESRALSGHTDRIRGALLLPSGRALSWSDDRTLRVWDVTSAGNPVLPGRGHAVCGALLLPDGRALSWSNEHALRVWDLAAGRSRLLAGHEDAVTGALLLPDGCVLSWSLDNTLRAWDLATGENRVLGESISDAVVLPDGRVLSWSWDGRLRVWDLATGESRPLTGHEDDVNGALPLPDGRALSWSDDRTLRVWDLATGESRPLTGHQDHVNGALVLPDGRALSWSQDHVLGVWDLATGNGRALTGHEGDITGALLLPDGRALSWSEDRTLRVWDLTTGESRTLAGHEGKVNDVLLLPDGRALSCSDDCTVWVWNLATGDGRPLTGHQGAVRGVLRLPDGRVLSWSVDHSIRRWDLDARDSSVAYFFDAIPTVVVPLEGGATLVGDQLGGIHVVEYQPAPAVATAISPPLPAPV